MRQVNMITAVSGATLTLRNPLIWDFNTGNPKIKWTFCESRGFSGIEDLKLDHSGTSGCTNFNLQYCYGCWLKGVYSYKPSGYHITILGTLNGEIRDSYIADAQTYGANNGGLAVYGSPSYGSNSSWKIENNIFNRVFPGVELQNSSSGFYVGYNYGYATMAAPTGATRDVHVHGQSRPPRHDEPVGGQRRGDVRLRRLFRRHRATAPPSGTTSPATTRSSGENDDPVRLNRLSYYYNIVGNVLGSTSENPIKYQENLDNCSGGPAIYRLGYPNIGNCGVSDVTGNPVPGGMTYPDAKVASTLLRWGNYDYFNRATRFVATEIPNGVSVPPDQIIPTSYYYAAKPGLVAVYDPLAPDRPRRARRKRRLVRAR